jgi:hypothetical protein
MPSMRLTALPWAALEAVFASAPIAYDLYRRGYRQPMGVMRSYANHRAYCGYLGIWGLPGLGRARHHRRQRNGPAATMLWGTCQWSSTRRT